MKSLGLFTNRNSRHDFVRSAFETLVEPSTNVYLAVAFFTDADAIKNFVSKGCSVRLVVRLGFPTSPYALSEVMKLQGVEVRYFTDHSFHPKLYLFGTQVALVGSANLTNSAMISNQEVVVEIGSEDPRMSELAGLFNEYWNDANVLTNEALKDYQSICEKFSALWRENEKHEAAIRDKLGHVISKNITRDKTRVSRENLFVEEYRKTYQECVGAFNNIRRIYEGVGIRKVKPELIPLRLEIDSFVSFVREIHATGEKWMETPVSGSLERDRFIEQLVLEWHKTSWVYFEETVVKESYPKLIEVFGSEDSIERASSEDIFEALSAVHAVGERLRYHRGELSTMAKYFYSVNDLDRVRKSLIYLLHGKASVEERMANLIYSQSHKLNEFGPASVQELVGWVNQEELPVINGRTTKVLQYLGFNVAQI